LAKLSEVEREYIDSISDNRLRSNLIKIKEGNENIWDPTAPRIIKDFTDHGTAHSERLVVFSNKILLSNPAIRLSDFEKYLLLSAIYLHDIGMQCDVIKFPQILERAKELGAKIQVDFSSPTSSEFNFEEQKAIRENHHYLSAAWIDYANKTGDTTIGPAIKDIPPNLVDDLIDICKFHSKVPISDCPIPFNYYPNEKKQFIAAILRFADELDIDKTRVNFDAIKNFRLSPQNSLYWYIHKNTVISFKSDREILTQVILHPEDKKEFGDIIYDIFIDGFGNKNQPVLSVLTKNALPIIISPESTIMENDRYDRFPKDVVDLILLSQKKGDPLLELVDEVRLWLHAIGYEPLDHGYVDSQTYELRYTIKRGAISNRLCVRCIGGEISVQDINSMDKVLDRKLPQGWIISDKRVSSEARAHLVNNPDIQIFNLSDFLNQNVWGPYFTILKSLVEEKKIPEYYVDLSCYKQTEDDTGKVTNKESFDSLDSYLDEWLTERGKMHISLLGEFGTGKTWFCRHYAYRQLERYLKNPANERLPLLITLREFTKTMDAEQLISDALSEQYKLEFLGSPIQIFKELNRRGKLLLILDGFDEMAKKIDYQTIVDNFWDLSKLVEEKSKVILSSRTEYFRRAKESENIFAGKELGRRKIILSPPRFEVLYLEKFSDKQLNEVLIKRLGDKDGSQLAEFILKNPQLLDIARKPVLIELLLAAMDEVSPTILENVTQVYLYATNKLLLRNIDTQRTFTSTSDKIYFLCELAWEMLSQRKLKIHYKEIPDRINAYFNDRIKDQNELDNWDFDLRNQSLLHRDAMGYYEFAHKSMAEYFVAFKMASELNCLNPTFLHTYHENDHTPCKNLISKKTILELSNTFGAISFINQDMWEVRKFLGEMLSDEFDRTFKEIISETKKCSLDEIKYTGGNALTLAIDLNKQISDMSLNQAKLSGADLSELTIDSVDLSETNFDDAVFVESSFTNCNFTKASFVSSDLSKSNMEGSNFALCNFKFTDFSGSNLSKCIFSNAKMARTLLGHSSMDDVIDFETIDGLSNSQLNDISGLDGHQIEFLIRNHYSFRIYAKNLEEYEKQKHISEPALNYLKMNLTKEQFESIFSIKDNKYTTLDFQFEEFFKSIKEKTDIKGKLDHNKIILGKIGNSSQLSYMAYFHDGGSISVKFTTSRELFRKSRKK